MFGRYCRRSLINQSYIMAQVYMSSSLELKVKQMHAALGVMRSSDISPLRLEHGRTSAGEIYYRINPNAGTTPEGLANVASQLVANIASLKDHLREWCTANNRRFTGERLIDTNSDVAIVHDLWNLDKHGRLRQSRSGRFPRIIELARALNMTTGTSGVPYRWKVDLFTGHMETTGEGNLSLAVTGQVIASDGTHLGSFERICEKAAHAWEEELYRSGVKVP
jgi:hypothetical protein